MIRAAWAFCLLIGGLNHARILLQHGLWWNYGGVNPLSAAYWSSLTLIDPLVAALLFLRPRAGIVLTVVLIVTNVAHNLGITAIRAPHRNFLERTTSDPYLLSQIAFMLFVLATVSVAWRGLPGRPLRSPSQPSRNHCAKPLSRSREQG